PRCPRFSVPGWHPLSRRRDGAVWTAVSTALTYGGVRGNRILSSGACGGGGRCRGGGGGGGPAGVSARGGGAPRAGGRPWGCRRSGGLRAGWSWPPAGRSPFVGSDRRV